MLIYAKSIKIIDSSAIVAADGSNGSLTDADTWATAKTFSEFKDEEVHVKVDVVQRTAGTSKNTRPKGVDASFETSPIGVLETSADDTEIKALVGKEVSLLVTPEGTISATNPQVIIRRFVLLRDANLSAPENSAIKLYGKKKCYSEAEAYTLHSTALATIEA